MAIINLAIFVAILGISFACFYKNKDWATRLHQYYIHVAKNNWAGSFFPWEASWTIIIFRAMFIGLGIILIVAAYPLAFGTVYF